MARHVSPVHRDHMLRVASAIEHRGDKDSIFGGELGFNMGDFVHTIIADWDCHVDQRFPECGTTACIAGWSFSLRNREINPVFVDDFDWIVEGSYFGFDKKEASHLFYSAVSDTQAVMALRLIADGWGVFEAIDHSKNVA